jgi:phenylalanyl-tRNA synthetase alpha chain
MNQGQPAQDVSAQAQEVSRAALAALPAANTSQLVEAWRVTHLGKSSALSGLMRGMRDLTPEQRQVAGKALNDTRQELEAALLTQLQAVEAAERAARLEAQRIDPTLPGVRVPLGCRHPIAATLSELRAIFRGMGFVEAAGPEVESDEYNFERLNIPADHPARDMWDTFYTTNGGVLRTHTSPVQVRVMERSAPNPVKIFCPGRVFRYEQVTARSESMFHQVEGLEIGPSVTMSDLLSVLQGLARRLFGPERRLRVRNSYFPFTEPSIEVDVDCFACGQRGCSLCKFTGWVEILGAGMVHPAVLRAGGYDPDVVTGYAFGLGVDRMALMRYGIDDIRHLYRNDLRFLEQFQSL